MFLHESTDFSVLRQPFAKHKNCVEFILEYIYFKIKNNLIC